MRFDDLLEDLASELAASGDRVLWDEAQQLMRGERATQDWGDRLASQGEWRMRLAGGHALQGTLTARAAEWGLFTCSNMETLIPWRALRWAQSTGQDTTSAQAATRRPGSLRAALRALSRHRGRVRLLIDTGDAPSGRLVQLGTDHLELREASGSVFLAGLGGLSAVMAER